MNNYKTFGIVFHNPKTMEQLNRLALSEHRTRSAQIEYIIEQYLCENENEFKVKHERD